MLALLSTLLLLAGPAQAQQAEPSSSTSAQAQPDGPPATAEPAYLPGLPLPFAVGADGAWRLHPSLGEPFLSAGAAPGWRLSAVDGTPFDESLAIQRQVASGPARSVRLHFLVDPPEPVPPAEGEPAPEPEGAEPPEPVETILVVPRDQLVRAQILGVLPWPDAFSGRPGQWQQTPSGAPAIADSGGATWVLDAATGALQPTRDTLSPWQMPEVYWALSPASWVVDQADQLASGDAAWASEALAGATRLRSFQGQAGDHLVLPAEDGLRVLTVDWPRGTPVLPTCNPLVPETCLTSGRAILADLGDRRGARKEALSQLTRACTGGVHRGCFEAVALQDERLAEQSAACIDGEISACYAVAKRRYELTPDEPDDLVLGLLEYSCDIEGAGSLGERLRRLADVGAGCMLLSQAYDQLKQPDRALLTLDQACVLGRAEACDEAAERRHQAFAARIVRECEDEALPVATSCVELGQLLQQEKIEAASLDDFGAFLRGCSLGAERGCVLLGDYVDRWGIENARVRDAENKLRRACDQGEQRACVGTAHLLVRHDPRKDPAYGEALTLFDAACQAGVASACEAGAQQRRIGKARKVEALSQDEMWTRACELSSATGCAGLGERKARSRKTWTQAYTAWTKACDLGDAHSCTELGLLVQRKHKEPWPGEQPQDDYLGRGCNNEDAEGCFWLAEDELPRRGEPPEDAYLLLARSCEGEYGPGCAELADVHLDRKTSFDDEIAARHLDTACANSEFESCKTLGQMYRTGKGVERDQQKAKELLDKFRFNERRKHVRIGLQGGFPYVAGATAELVLPIPVGPALSASASYSYIPGGGQALVVLDGDGSLDNAPDMSFMSADLRLYPNTQARGVWGGVGYQQVTASGGDLAEDRVRGGPVLKLGMRSDNKLIYTGLEIGISQLGLIDLNDFDEEETGSFPLILPTLGLSVGLAFL